MLENPEELIGGMKIILQLFDHAKGVLGIEDNKPDCIEKLTELVKDEPRIEVCPLQTKYPQGGERQLIYAVTRPAPSIPRCFRQMQDVSWIMWRPSLLFTVR